MSGHSSNCHASIPAFGHGSSRNLSIPLLKTKYFASISALLMITSGAPGAPLARTALVHAGVRPGTFSALEIAQEYRNGRILAKARDGSTPQHSRHLRAAPALTLNGGSRAFPASRSFSLTAGFP